MSSPLNAAFYTAFKNAVVSAWSVSKVHYGTPILIQPAVPYAIVSCININLAWMQPIQDSFIYEFEITGVFPIPQDDNPQSASGTAQIDLMKIAKANALYNAIYTGAVFGTGGSQIAYDVRFMNVDMSHEPDTERNYKVSITVTLQADANRL